VSCVVVFNVVRFDLRVFLGFLAGFYLFALQLIRFDKIRGLEQLKMRFYYSGIIILMLLCCNKMHFAENLRACMYACMYIHIYSITIVFLIL
jgi:hypothetical protein